jgi:hypothetical protein
MKTLIQVFATCCALLCAGAAQAGSLIDLQVISRSTGQRMPVYQYLGKTYVVGTPGERYSLQLRNLTGARVMGVLSVDGVNAITGDTASPNQSGYVLGPYQVAEITGWRKSNEEVARFYFTPLPDSYAARTDRPGNVGVIGLAVFREYVEPPPPQSPPAYAPSLSMNQAARDSATPPASPAPSAKASGAIREQQAEDKLGTGHGEREHSVVTNTEFRRASRSPAEVVALWYDSRERLASAGVIPRNINPPYAGNPNPFPAHFVADPRDYSYRTHD